MTFRNLKLTFVLIAWAGTFTLSAVIADDPAGDVGNAERQALLKEMRSAVAAIQMSEKVGDQSHAAKLVEEPLFRYSDEQRKIRDATMWVWTVQGRPIALMKLERYGFPDAGRKWLFNVGSTSPALLNVKWPFGRGFTSKKPGMTFQPLPDAPKPAESKPARSTQLKQLSRRFAVTILGVAAKGDRSEMRLLPMPLYRYASEPDKILDGALFGFSSTGTNPDAVIAIQLCGAELNSAEWKFAMTGMTAGGLEMRLDEKQVWSQPYLVGRGEVFETKTWFYSGRVE